MRESGGVRGGGHRMGSTGLGAWVGGTGVRPGMEALRGMGIYRYGVTGQGARLTSGQPCSVLRLRSLFELSTTPMLRQF